MESIKQKIALLAAASLGCLSLGFASAKAEPAIWVAKQGQAKVYFFGTFHALKNDVVWETPKVKGAFGKSQELWLEIANLDDAAAAQPLMLKYGIDKEHPLSTKLSPEDNALLATDAGKLGAPVAAFEPLRPWLAALQLSLAPMMKAGYAGTSGADLTLKKEAIERHEPVRGFETIEEQLRFFCRSASEVGSGIFPPDPGQLRQQPG